MCLEGAGQFQSWTERRLVVRSLRQAQERECAARPHRQSESADRGMNQRGRGKRRFAEVAALRREVVTIVQCYEGGGLHLAALSPTGAAVCRCERTGGRPARWRKTAMPPSRSASTRRTLEAAVRRVGWRVYSTNQPAEQLSLAQAVLAYRNEYLVEQSLGRLKGRPPVADAHVCAAR